MNVLINHKLTRVPVSSQIIYPNSSVVYPPKNTIFYKFKVIVIMSYLKKCTVKVSIHIDSFQLPTIISGRKWRAYMLVWYGSLNRSSQVRTEPLTIFWHRDAHDCGLSMERILSVRSVPCNANSKLLSYGDISALHASNEACPKTYKYIWSLNKTVSVHPNKAFQTT